MDLRTIVIVSVLVAVMSIHEVCARPSYSESWHPNRVDTRHVNECESPTVSQSVQNEARELCQRCAKVTKSRLAYPLCCERREETRVWCQKFLNFGLASGD